MESLDKLRYVPPRPEGEGIEAEAEGMPRAEAVYA